MGERNVERVLEVKLVVLDQKTGARQYSRTLKWVLCSNRKKKVVSVVVVVVLSTIVSSVEVEPIVHDVDPEAAG